MNRRSQSNTTATLKKASQNTQYFSASNKNEAPISLRPGRNSIRDAARLCSGVRSEVTAQ